MLLTLGVVVGVVAAFVGGMFLGRTGLLRSAPEPVPAAQAAASSPPEPTPRGRLVVHGTGDVNLDPGYVTSLRTRGFASPWSDVEGLFRADGVTVVNLECTASRLGAPEDKDFTFRCPPEALPSMREAGVDVANLGNNHAGDFGPEALVDARRNVESAGIVPVGAGANAGEAYTAAILEVAGWRVAVLGFGGVVPELDWLATPDRPGMASGDDVPAMVAAVRAADEAADLVFVTIHWGAELDTEPHPEDVQRAHAIIDAGADGIFGHHAHRLQPLGWYRDRPIAWGLGNLVWPRLSAAAARTAVAELIVHPDGRVEACLLPGEIDSAGHPVLHPGAEDGCG